MKNREIRKKVCPWRSGIYKGDVNCLGTKCAWVTLVKRFGYSNEESSDTEIPKESKSIIELLSPSELPKKDWEYECGLVRNPTSNQAVEM